MLLKTARKVAVAVIGTTVVAIGVVMIVAPGPAVVVIPAGLAILGTEFLWAKRLLTRMKTKAQEIVSGFPIGSTRDRNAQADATTRPRSDPDPMNKAP